MDWLALLGGRVEGLGTFWAQGKETDLGWGKACRYDQADTRQVGESVLSLVSGSAQGLFSKEIQGKGGGRRDQQELGERGRRDSCLWQQHKYLRLLAHDSGEQMAWFSEDQIRTELRPNPLSHRTERNPMSAFPPLVDDFQDSHGLVDIRHSLTSSWQHRQHRLTLISGSPS